MWFPRILSNLNLSLLTVTYRVDALDSGSFLLCPVRKPENDPAWLEASSVPLSTQGQPSIPSERPLSMLGNSVLSSSSSSPQPILSSSRCWAFPSCSWGQRWERAEKKESIVLPLAGHLYFWIALLCGWCNHWSCFAECELCPPTGL